METVVDPVNRIGLVNPKKIIDIGCEPGNSTQVLADLFKEAYMM